LIKSVKFVGGAALGGGLGAIAGLGAVEIIKLIRSFDSTDSPVPLSIPDCLAATEVPEGMCVAETSPEIELENTKRMIAFVEAHEAEMSSDSYGALHELLGLVLKGQNDPNLNIRWMKSLYPEATGGNTSVSIEIRPVTDPNNQIPFILVEKTPQVMVDITKMTVSLPQQNDNGDFDTSIHERMHVGMYLAYYYAEKEGFKPRYIRLPDISNPQGGFYEDDEYPSYYLAYLVRGLLNIYNPQNRYHEKITGMDFGYAVLWLDRNNIRYDDPLWHLIFDSRARKFNEDFLLQYPDDPKAPLSRELVASIDARWDSFTFTSEMETLINEFYWTGIDKGWLQHGIFPDDEVLARPSSFGDRKESTRRQLLKYLVFQQI
jgi:hypothetical protein